MSKPYLYMLEEALKYEHPLLKGIYFSNNWCQILGGVITIHKGYAWDGCSPKWDVLGLFVIGSPDGRLSYGKPITYQASLIHDALCQFRREIPITKEIATQIFSDLLEEAGFKLRPLYVVMTNILGPQDFKEV